MNETQIGLEGAASAPSRPVQTTSPGTRPQSHAQHLAELDERAWSLVASSMSPETLRAYRHDWDHFVAWCERYDQGFLPASPDTVKRYLAELSQQYRPATIQRRLAAIALAHRTADLESPTEHHEVRAAHSGVRRQLKVAPKSARPLRFEELLRVLQSMPAGELKTARDHALLLIGFYGGLRRSEIVALDVEDIEFADRGLLVTVRGSKTDQEGVGRVIGIPHDTNGIASAPRAIRNWLRESGIESGPLFRPINRHGHLSDERLAPQGVWTVIKSRVESAGLEPADYSAHSLRSGLATSAAEAGASERSIMNQTGHRSERVVRGYIHRATVFDDNPVTKILRDHRATDAEKAVDERQDLSGPNAPGAERLDAEEDDLSRADRKYLAQFAGDPELQAASEWVIRRNREVSKLQADLMASLVDD